MNAAARIGPLLAAASLIAGCAHPDASPTRPKNAAVLADGALLPSPRLIVGRIIAIDAGQGFAILEVAPDAPADAVTDGAELIARTGEFRETGRLRVSRYLRGRTLGTKIVGGQPATGDEVVWLAP
jgi:hypothetical protein